MYNRNQIFKACIFILVCHRMRNRFKKYDLVLTRGDYLLLFFSFFPFFLEVLAIENVCHSFKGKKYNPILSEAIKISIVILLDFWIRYLTRTHTGSCVTAPPLTAGQQVRFTVAVMGNHTLLL